MTSFPWFRVYSEILDDRKIKRICKKTGHSKALVIGIWVSLLALANNSPVRGTLTLSEDMPYTLEDMEDELGLPGEIINQLVDEFSGMGMINGKATLKITHWEKRQFKSDTSTERVREYREKHPEKRYSETLQKRYGNVLESESESESDKIKEEEEEIDKNPAPTTSILPFLAKWTGKIVAIPSDQMDKVEQITCLREEYGDEIVGPAIQKEFNRWINTPHKDGIGKYKATNFGWVTWAQEALMAPPVIPPPDADDEEIEHERNKFNKQISAAAEEREKLAKLREEQVRNR